ncbi:MAG: hypothetical protein AMXMBFR53_08450 [Gemmatimonadota bacterium]
MPTACVLSCAAMVLAMGSRPREIGAQTWNDTTACRQETLGGRVGQGESFEAGIGGGLSFRLDPHAGGGEPQGWTIRVVPETGPDTDYSWVATPPYRHWNARYLDTSYGLSAAEALARTPRDFWFVASPRDYEVATEALEVLLWPHSHAQAVVDAAGERLAGVTRYPGTLWVVDGSVTSAGGAHPNAAIEWLEFRVQLCVPTGGRMH